MARTCPVCSVEKKGDAHSAETGAGEKQGMCIHQKLMLGMMAAVAVVLILVFVVF